MQALAKLLHATNWSQRENVAEVHRLLPLWRCPTPENALELLDSSFGDPVVRRYAVECLNELSDHALSVYLLQLVQVLKYEPFHDSALGRFLLKRAVANRTLGHAFFWLLKAVFSFAV